MILVKICVKQNHSSIIFRELIILFIDKYLSPLIMPGHLTKAIVTQWATDAYLAGFQAAMSADGTGLAPTDVDVSCCYFFLCEIFPCCR